MVGLTPAAGKLRSHRVPKEADESEPKCPGSGNMPRPETTTAEASPPKTPTTPESANSATCSRTSDTGDPLSGESPSTDDCSTDEKTPEIIPNVDDYVRALSKASENVGTFIDTMRKQFEGTGAFSRPAPVEVDQPTLFSQPAGTRVSGKPTVKPMSPVGAEVCARIKEMFHGYVNRMDRNQQQTLGPSEIGHPCDRRLALSLMRYPTVNPGGDNWASFVGTCVHAGLEEMLVWANAGSGRYAPELRVMLPSKHVPYGTTDVLDRSLLLLMDWKIMGDWSLNKLKTVGPPQHYRVQGHTYGYGAQLRGEKVKHICIVGMPRGASSLDDMYVWDEPYDASIAIKALGRVEDIAGRLKGCTETIGLHNDGCGCPDTEQAAYGMPFDNSDCRYCPFFKENAPASKGGVCNGKG